MCFEVRAFPKEHYKNLSQNLLLEAVEKNPKNMAYEVQWMSLLGQLLSDQCSGDWVFKIPVFFVMGIATTLDAPKKLLSFLCLGMFCSLVYLFASKSGSARRFIAQVMNTIRYLPTEILLHVLELGDYMHAIQTKRFLQALAVLNMAFRIISPFTDLFSAKEKKKNRYALCVNKIQ
ncbi:hypothetical protein ACJX0J_008058 [Zea mays]